MTKFGLSRVIVVNNFMKIELDRDDRRVESPRKPSKSEYEPLIDDAQAAEFLGGFASKTVQRMARRGELPSHQVGKFYRYKKSELTQWLIEKQKKKIVRTTVP